MVARLQRDPQVTAIVVTPYTPGTPGHYETVLKEVSGGVPVGGSSSFDMRQYILDQVEPLRGTALYPDGAPIQFGEYTVIGYEVYDATGYRLGSGGSDGWSSGGIGGSATYTVSVREWVPPSSGTPPVYAYSTIGASGWDAGGLSRGIVTDSGHFTFKLSGQAAMAGFSFRGVPYAYASVAHGWLRNGDTLQVVESGVTRYTAPKGTPTDAELSVRRSGATVEYLIGDQVAYTSTTPSYGDLQGMGIPYGPGEHVDAIELEDYPSSIVLQAQLPAAAARLSGHNGIELIARAPALLGAFSVPFVFSLDAVLPAADMRLFADGAGAELGASIPPMQIRLTGEPFVQYNYIFTMVDPLQADLQMGVASSPMDLDAALPAPVALLSAHDAYSELRTSIPGGLFSRFDGYDGEHSLMRELVRCADWARLGDEILLVIAHSQVAVSASTEIIMHPALLSLDTLAVASEGALSLIDALFSIDGLSVESQAALTRIMHLASLEQLWLGDRATAGNLLELATMERVAINSGLEMALREAVQYAINVESGGVTTYQGFDFRGFATVAGSTYAWRSDGLYRIGGQHSEPTQAFIDFGASDFGASQLKRMTTAWLGIRTDADLYLRVQADDGDESIYRLMDTRGTRKALLGKGATGRVWSMRLELVDASYAALDAVEIEVNPIQRRIGGRRT